MSLETKTTLTKETLDTLQDLIQVNLDSQLGLKDAADSVNDPVVEELFRSVLSERCHFADELKMYVEWNDECACDEQSWSGKVHKLWMDIRAKINSGDAYVILIEAERGEDHKITSNQRMKMR